jgi:hypothetical protein
MAGYVNKIMNGWVNEINQWFDKENKSVIG